MTEQILLEAEPSAAARQAHKLGLHSVGYGFWADKRGKRVARTFRGKLVKLTPKDAKSSKATRSRKSASPVRTQRKPTIPKKKAPITKGGITPGGDSSIKAQMLTGKTAGAPGSPTSAFNEIISGEAMHMALRNPNLMNDPLALAKLIQKKYEKSVLYKSLPSSARKPLNKKNKDISSIAKDTALAGINEAKRIAKANARLNWNAKDLQINHYWGHEASKRAMITSLETLKKTGGTLISQFGEQIPIDEAIELTKGAGSSGSHNPSDTATFVYNKRTKQMVWMLTSNKVDTTAIQANSTPTQEYGEMANYIQTLSDLDDAQKERATRILADANDKIASLNSNLDNGISSPIAEYFLKNPKAIALFTEYAQKGDKNRKFRYIKLVIDKYSLKKLKKGKTGQALAQELEAIGWKPKMGEPSEKQKVKAFLYHVEKSPSVTKDERKLLTRTSEHISYEHPKFSPPDTKDLASKSSEEGLNAMHSALKKLSRIKLGSGITLSNLLEARNLAAKMHLSPAFDDVTNKQGVYKWPGVFEVNMGNAMVSDATLKECLGVSSRQQYFDRFRVGEGVYSRGKGGEVTGERSTLYRLDEGGHQVPVAHRVIRSKDGVGGALQTMYRWDTQMQNCFKSHS